jgi:hypothetical protein
MKNKTKIKPVKKIGKKATIGTTITWFAAAFLIFFIIIFFILVSGLVSVPRGKPDYNLIGDEIKIANLVSVKNLPALLSTEKDGKAIEEHILEWADYANNFVTSGYDATDDLKKHREKKDFLEKEISKILDELSSKTETKAYSLYITYKFTPDPFDQPAEKSGFGLIHVQKNSLDIDWKSRSTHFIFPFDVTKGEFEEDNPQIEGYFYLGE